MSISREMVKWIHLLTGVSEGVKSVYMGMKGGPWSIEWGESRSRPVVMYTVWSCSCLNKKVTCAHVWWLYQTLKIFKNIFIDFRERWKDRERHWCDRNIDRLPPIHTLTGNRTPKLLVHGMMLEPTEPHRPRHKLKSFLAVPQT